MGIPGVSITEASGIPPLPDAGIRSRVAMIAPASAGTFDAKPIYALSDLSEYSQGVLARHGKHLFAETKTPFLAVRCAATNVGTYDTIDNSEFTGTAVPAVVATTVPTDEAELYIKIVTGGTLGVTGIEYRRSDSNGREGDDSMPLRSLGTATRISFADVNAAIELDPPAAQVTALIALAVELRADRLLHYADATAHNSADTTAAALITLAAPTTGAEAIAVINQVRLADISHYANSTAHDSPDFTNEITLAAATTLHGALFLAVQLKAKANLHNAATYPAANDSLKAATATTVAVQSYGATSGLIAGGITSLNAAPGKITFTTAGGTASDAPATATISGTNAATDAADTEVVNIGQTATTVTSTKFWYGTGLSITYSAGDGTGATVAIGIADRVHNSADASNNITAADPTAGTVIAGDIIRCGTNAPTPADSDITDAIAKLVESSSTPAMVLFPGRTVASLGTTISTGANTMRDAGKPCAYIVQPRQANAETPEVHVNAVETEWTAAVTDNRICVVAGDYLCTFNDGAKLRERLTGAATHFAVRAVNTEYFRTTWQTQQLDKVTILDAQGVPIGWDEAKTPTKPRKVQTFYRVPAGDRPLVPAIDYTLADLDNDRTTTLRERRVTDELHRIVRTWAFSRIGALAATTRIPNTNTGRLNESVRLSFQQSLAAIIAANMGGTLPDVAISDTDKPDLVAINPIVTLAGAIVTLAVTVNYTIIGAIGRINTTLSVRTGS